MVQIIAVVALLAQDIPKPEDLASIQGKVINKLTREPVKYAEITVRANEFAPEILKSGSDGAFSVDMLRPGRYSIEARKTGFTIPRRKAGQAPEFFILEKGTKKSGITLELLPQATVSGRVTDDNGEPLAGVNITAEALRQTPSPSSFGRVITTSDRGEYRLYDLEPGRYRIRAVPPLNPMIMEPRSRDTKSARAVPEVATGPRDGPVPVYYPAATNAEQASAVEVVAGDERQGVDIQMVKARVFEVSGKVIPLAGTASANGIAGMGSAVLISTRKAQFSAASTSIIDTAGRFVLKGVAPGSYVVMAMLGSSPTQPARLRIEVGQGDVSNLEIPFQAPVTITGAMKAPDGVDLKLVRLLLGPTDGMGMPAQGPVDPKGTFRLENVMPGMLSLRVMGLDADAFVQTVRLDSQDVDVDEFTLKASGSAEAGPLEVTISKVGGSIEGTVRTANDASEQEGATLVLWPATGPPKPSLARIVRSVSKGHFQMKGIRPGKYLLAAFDNLPMVSGQPDPEALLSAKIRAESILIEPGTKLTKNLKSLGDLE